MSLKVQLHHLEEKINVLTERLNQGDEWKRHLELWLLNHLGMNFPPDLSLCSSKPSIKLDPSTENNNENYKENEENQFSNLIKFRTKRTYTPDNSNKKSENVKIYQKKKRIEKSSSAGSSINKSATPQSQSQSHPPHSHTVEIQNELPTTSYIITPTEIVQSPANEIEIDNVKYEQTDPTEESSQEGELGVSEGVMQEEPHIQEEARYRIQEENNVLHIIKIETDHSALDGEHAVINYGDSLPIVQLTNVPHDNNPQLSSNLAVFSGAIGEETAIGFLNPDGSVTPCRPNVIISAGSGISAGGTLQQFSVVPAPSHPPHPPPPPPPAPKPADDPVDPKGTFVCNICENSFQGLYLFRQHEKKSECRRIAKKLKKSEPSSSSLTSTTSPSTSQSSSSPGFKTSTESYPSSSSSSSSTTSTSSPNLTPVGNTPILKYKCSVCGSCYASEAYLRFHLSKVHNTNVPINPRVGD